MNENAAAIIGLYQRHAAAWDTARGDRLFETPWLDRFRALLPQAPAVLDLGCGTARPLARALIERNCAITGIDAAPAMIAACQTAFPTHHWQIADMRTLSLGRRFDGILAWDSLFHLTHDDQRRMFPIFAQHAAPTAALMFTSGPSHGEALGEWQGEPLYHASLDPHEYTALLSTHGFQTIHHSIEDPTCGHHTIWLAARSPAPPPTPEALPLKALSPGP